MQFILNGFIKCMGNFSTRLIIDTAFSINVCNFLIKPSFACPDFPNPFEQFIEVILTKKFFPLFQPFIVENKTFNNKLFQGFGGPNSELCCLMRINPVPNGNNCIEIIEVRKVFLAVSGSYSNFSNN